MTALAVVVTLAAAVLLWQWATGALEGEMNDYPAPCEGCGRRRLGLDADLLCVACVTAKQAALAALLSVSRREKT